jgi:hypothetical protein
MISLSLKGSSRSKKALPLLARMMSFHNEDLLRIINKGGVDCFYDFKKQSLVTAAGVDNFIVNDFKFKHILLEPKFLEPSDTLNRLVAIADKVKIMQNMLQDARVQDDNENA